MNIRKSAVNMMIISAVVSLAALALALSGVAPRFNFGAVSTVSFTALWLAILAAVAISFLFGWARYDAGTGFTLCIAMLHDQLLSLALASLISVVFGLSSVMPALAIAGAVFTCLFSIPVLREARTVAKSTSLREMSRDEVAELAVKNTRTPARLTGVVVLLGFVAFIVSGNLSMIGAILPLITGLIAAIFSSCLITPYIWAAFSARRTGKR